ncbi:conserved phage C-terminal domain-containing protein [Riemerella anatipestifer]|uniref:conserved phage C-terminal domain-containing protein n=1 Tax=Riemerella anatipestifer TaxID=34085 RepID=UPI0021F862A7|nr:conserved phage C-terminal domain-containing protein [Riemerella anatipestifer]MCW0510669.1 conserved phage C-terminal domain-containing protein [Riemerella anatipestifer]MCW0518432.1 conserved phage C-terminal domain-containing protein [Riemerella anatipestifer]MDY3389752.1 conserved phage C-terminal domain-containing protein [Riemerella anatipestifer]MDY3517694.1 conserved phage C-terminal domain-containing protein [Riemerella anatipestifer]MDY3542625.1 conserved phage C-terminal domain-c
MQRDSFIFYRSFYEAIRELPRDIQGEVLTAIMEYGLDGVTTDNLKPIARAIVALIKPQIDANNRRFDNGKKGGRPPKTETETKPKHNLTETKDKPNKNLTETETKPNKNVNDNVNVNDDNVLLEKEPKRSLSDLAEEGKKKPNNDIDFEKLLNFISDKTKRRFKTINDQIKRKYKARLKEGYTKEDILEAIENAVKDKYHMEQGYKYLTPEFFSRPVTLDKYKNTTSQKATEKKKTYGIWSV